MEKELIKQIKDLAEELEEMLYSENKSDFMAKIETLLILIKKLE